VEHSLEQTSSKWARAAKDGLFLSLICVVTLTASNFLTDKPLITWIIFLAQLVASIWLLRRFMASYGADNEGESTFGYGVRVCLFSSFIIAVWSFAMFQFIFPDMVTKAMDSAFEVLGNNMTDDLRDSMLKLEDMFPQMMSISSFFKDFLEGILFSAILAGGTTKRDIFSDSDIPQQEEEEL
jgi:hypothetical protein